MLLSQDSMIEVIDQCVKVVCITEKLKMLNA